MIVNEGGKKLPKLTTPGTAADLLTGKELIDQDGRKVEGSMPFWEVPAPYILNDYAVSEGKLTAVVTLTPGYNKFRGSKSLTYQLSTKDDPNFIPENIVSGKRIFGVTGTADFLEYYQNAVGADIVIESTSLSGNGEWIPTISIRIPSSIDFTAGHFICEGDPTGASVITILSLIKTKQYDGKYHYSGIFISDGTYYYAYEVNRASSSGDPDGYGRLFLKFNNISPWDFVTMKIKDESYYVYRKF